MSIRASLFCILSCILTMAIFIRPTFTRAPAAQSALQSALLDEQLLADARTPDSVGYALERMIESNKPATVPPVTDSREKISASGDRDRIEQLSELIRNEPERAIGEIQTQLDILGRGDTSEGVALLNLALSIPGHEEKLGRLGMSELMARRDFSDLPYLSSAMHVFLAATKDPEAAVQGATTAILAQSEESDQTALMTIVDLYIPQGRATIERELQARGTQLTRD